MPYNSGYRTVREVKDLPQTMMHYAVLSDTSYSYDDGYGGNSTGHYMDYTTFDTLKDLQTWVEATEARNSAGGYGSKTVYRVLEVRPVEVKKTVTIVLGK